MSGRRPGLLGKFFWTAGTFGASFFLKFGLNVCLSRLLASEIFGVMVVVNAVKMGVELLTDVGIEQNIVHNPRGLERDFLDTAWTMQALRGAMLSLLFAALSPLLAATYHIDVRVFLLASLSPILGALHSTALYVLAKTLEVKKRNLFEIGYEAAGFVISVALAIWLRNVWAPIIALLAAVAIRSAASYLLPHAGHRLILKPQIVREIFHFGKWIALSSLVMYAATYFDRLYLGRVAPLALLGIYGIARTIAELPTTLARRMSYQILFPALAGGEGGGKRDVLAEIGPARWTFVAAVAAIMGVGVAVADIAVNIVYDARYHQAGWMLSVLLAGGLFSVLSNLNEALLLGAGKPVYSSLANVLRFCTLGVGLPLAYALGGFAGAVIMVAFTEVLQYGYIAVGMHRVRLAFWRQDMGAIILAIAVLLLCLAARHALGWGLPWDGLSAALR